MCTQSRLVRCRRRRPASRQSCAPSCQDLVRTTPMTSSRARCMRRRATPLPHACAPTLRSCSRATACPAQERIMWKAPPSWRASCRRRRPTRWVAPTTSGVPALCPTLCRLGLRTSPRAVQSRPARGLASASAAARTCARGSGTVARCSSTRRSALRALGRSTTRAARRPRCRAHAALSACAWARLIETQRSLSPSCTQRLMDRASTRRGRVRMSRTGTSPK
mmetsp:Transcript_35143/g.104010  ORF Transcript_35143/g.104010 Transcript_35143/m.104010 type:complete len:222 (-) Transcript_35143:280-945(-)